MNLRYAHSLETGHPRDGNGYVHFQFFFTFLTVPWKGPALEASCVPHIMRVFPSYSAFLFPAVVSPAMAMCSMVSGKLMLQKTKSSVKSPQPGKPAEITHLP